MLPFGGQCIRKHGRAEIGFGPYFAPQNTSLLRECGGTAGVFGVESTKADRTPETDMAQGGGIYKRCSRLFSTQRQTGSYQATKKDCPPLPAFFKISFSFPNKSQCKKQSSCKQALSLAWQPSWPCPHNSVGFPPALQFLPISTEELRRKTFAKNRPILCSSLHLFPAETAKGRQVMSKTPLYERSIRREVFSIRVHTVCLNKAKKLLCTEEVGRTLPCRLSEP